MLGIPQHELAPLIGVHYNTLSRAMHGESVNRNNAKKLEAFAEGEIAAAKTLIELTPTAADFLRKIAAEAKAEPNEWESAWLYWLSIQTAYFRQFIQDSVRDAIQATRMAGLAVHGKGSHPKSNPHAGGAESTEAASSKG